MRACSPELHPARADAVRLHSGVLVAEIVAHFLPRLVDIHNYSGAHGTQQKLYNWVTLNNKVLKRLGFVVASPDCERIANAEPGASCGC